MHVAFTALSRWSDDGHLAMREEHRGPVLSYVWTSKHRPETNLSRGPAPIEPPGCLLTWATHQRPPLIALLPLSHSKSQVLPIEVNSRANKRLLPHPQNTHNQQPQHVIDIPATSLLDQPTRWQREVSTDDHVQPRLPEHSKARHSKQSVALFSSHRPFTTSARGRRPVHKQRQCNQDTDEPDTVHRHDVNTCQSPAIPATHPYRLVHAARSLS
ncbi:hypothetical protein B0T22DRAFT_280363 [Podospora appendiculata]|uniref:Uncharacterized protein n=1 Tax=Podospora appendiculata TaxID=314037 RepID=A0AAE1C813_9PEZI|nr:hypothetical protein B0T22DRAFT_280363 [Podospora appendiculata]